MVINRFRSNWDLISLAKNIFSPARPEFLSPARPERNVVKSRDVADTSTYARNSHRHRPFGLHLSLRQGLRQTRSGLPGEVLRRSLGPAGYKHSIFGVNFANRVSCYYLNILCVIFTSSLSATPKISIITSIYKSDQFIAQFMQDITQQTIFDQCELLLIDANSPGQEYQIIQPYLVQYPNIRYWRLPQDPGLYAVWNLGIQQAQGEYLTNANTDDRLAPDCYAQHAACLDQHPEIALVYSDCYITSRANQLFAQSAHEPRSQKAEFSLAALQHRCLPSFNPMWRKAVHAQCGYFDESFKIAGDYEFWLRLATNGLQFKKVPAVLGVYYVNPTGLSTPGSRHWEQLLAERKRIKAKYHA
ncbi:MAG TPA: glycosyltransferase [Candidatus Babeliales bacterium]|nr:glycosyltransferase [Candidatus Babeliales bacterium]